MPGEFKGTTRKSLYLKPREAMGSDFTRPHRLLVLLWMLEQKRPDMAAETGGEGRKAGNLM